MTNKYKPIGTPGTCQFCGATKKRYCKHRIKWYQDYEIMTYIEALVFALIIGGFYLLLIL